MGAWSHTCKSHDFVLRYDITLEILQSCTKPWIQSGLVLAWPILLDNYNENNTACMRYVMPFVSFKSELFGICLVLLPSLNITWDTCSEYNTTEKARFFQILNSQRTPISHTYQLMLCTKSKQDLTVIIVFAFHLCILQKSVSRTMAVSWWRYKTMALGWRRLTWPDSVSQHITSAQVVF